MESIKLDNISKRELRNFYEEELDKTLNRLQHIKSVLDQIDGAASQIHVSVLKKGVAAVAPEAASAPIVKSVPMEKPKPAGKRRGPKAVWESLVLKRMRQMDRPVTYEQLTDEIMAFAKLPESKRLNTKRAIVNVSFKLRNRDHKINTFSNGQREKYLALRSWFDDSGKIKKEYVKKIQE